MTREITRTHFGIYGVIEKENSLLLIVKKRGPYTGLYDLPGGSPEKGEEELQTLAREMAEETGCALLQFQNRREEVVFFEGFKEDDGRNGCLCHRGVLFDCVVAGIPDNTIADLDSDGASWVNKSDLTAQNATPFVLLSVQKRVKS